MSLSRAAEARRLGACLLDRLGALLAQTSATFAGSVDRGWRVELFPSRVGTRARVHLNVAGRLR